MKRLLLFLTAILILQHANAQEVINVMASQSGEKAIIKYDIANSSPSTNYFVKLYYSTDGGSSFSQELRYVTGDVGANVAGGTGKTITWNTMKEVNALIGDVVFKVEANTASKLPDPVYVKDLVFNITNCKRIGSSVKLEFELTNNGTDLKIKYYNYNGADLQNKSHAVDSYGNLLEIESAKLSGRTMFEDIILVKGVINKGVIIIKSLDSNSQKVALLEMYDNFYRHEYTFQARNIPIQ